MRRYLPALALVLSTLVLPVRAEPEPDAPLACSEQLSRATQMIEGMREKERQVTRLRAEEIAPGARDIVRLNCINDKLQQIRGLLSLVSEAMPALEQACEDEDPETAGFCYTQISVADQKITDLARDADQCVGETTVIDTLPDPDPTPTPEPTPTPDAIPAPEPTPNPEPSPDAAEVSVSNDTEASVTQPLD